MAEQKIVVDLSEQKQKTLDQQKYLAEQVIKCSNIGEWLFYDCFYNCDGLALQRTLARLRKIDKENDPDMVFGLIAYLALRGYWKMRDAFKQRDMPFKPDLKPDPNEIEASLASNNVSHVAGLQFFSTMAHENALTAKDIWDDAYANDAWIGLAQTVMLISLSCQRQADATLAGV